jgi:predicted nucleic acid-binding protein
MYAYPVEVLEMATLTIRGLDPQTHARLRIQAARHGRSMEAEVRAILEERLAPRPGERGLGTKIHQRFGDHRGRAALRRCPAARGRRKAELSAAVNGLLSDEFDGRVLPFDQLAARRYADVVSGRQRLGQPIGIADAQIAAICGANGATLATRNMADFEDTGIEIINPWSLA